MGRMTTKREAFVSAYMGRANMVGVEAARMAGYTGDNATLAVTASQLLRDHKVKAAIAEALAVHRLDRDELLDRLSTMARFDPTQYLDVSTGLVLWDIKKMSEDGLGHMIRRLRLVEIDGQVLPELEFVNVGNLLMWLLTRLDRIEERETPRRLEVSFDSDELRAELDALCRDDEG